MWTSKRAGGDVRNAIVPHFFILFSKESVPIYVIWCDVYFFRLIIFFLLLFSFFVCRLQVVHKWDIIMTSMTLLLWLLGAINLDTLAKWLRHILSYILVEKTKEREREEKTTFSNARILLNRRLCAFNVLRVARRCVVWPISSSYRLL